MRRRLRRRDLTLKEAFEAALKSRRSMRPDQLAALGLEKRLSEEFQCEVIYNKLTGAVWSALDFEHELCKVYLGSRGRTPNFSGSSRPDTDSNKAHPVTLGERGKETLFIWKGPIAKCFKETRAAFAVGSDPKNGWIRAPDVFGNYREGQQEEAEKKARTEWPAEVFGFLMSEWLQDPDRCEKELENQRLQIETEYREDIIRQELELEKEKTRKRKARSTSLGGRTRKQRKPRVQLAVNDPDDSDSKATDELSDVHSDANIESSDSDLDDDDLVEVEWDERLEGADTAEEDGAMEEEDDGTDDDNASGEDDSTEDDDATENEATDNE